MYQLNNNFNSNLFNLNEKKLIKTQNSAKISETDYEKVYSNFLRRLTNIYTNRYVYENLPIEIESWFIENSLMLNGVCCFSYDDVLENYVVTAISNFNELNIYGIPTTWTAYAINGYCRNLTEKNSVLIFNNNNFFSDYDTINIYAERLATIYITMLKNIILQKNSVAILTSKDTLLSAKNIVNQIDENKDFIFIKDTYDINSIKPINLQVDFKADKLRGELNTTFSEFLNWCGVESFSSDKKERLISGESSGNDGYIELQRNIGLNARKRCVERINKMYNLNINVKFNSEIATLVNLGNEYVSEVIQKGE